MKNIMEYTTRKLTLTEFVKVELALKESLISMQNRMDEKKESMKKNDPTVYGKHHYELHRWYKRRHDLLAKEACELKTTISIFLKNSLSLWADEENGQ